jgi:hypothetical protein
LCCLGRILKMLFRKQILENRRYKLGQSFAKLRLSWGLLC